MKSIRVAVNSLKDVPHKVFKRAAKELCHRVIDRTPIDTGLLVNSWVPTKTRPSRRIVKTRDKTRKRAKEKAAKIANEIPVDGKMFLTNNQPYAVIIEMGRQEGPPARGSYQAPSGMMRISAAEWQSIISKHMGRKR